MSLWTLLCNNRQDTGESIDKNKTSSSLTTFALTSLDNNTTSHDSDLPSASTLDIVTPSTDQSFHQLLPSIEQTLQQLIEEFNVCISKQFRLKRAGAVSQRFRNIKPSKVNLEREVNLLRKLMRQLRRWRNGSEFYTMVDVSDLREYLIKSRERLLMHKMDRIYDYSSQINYMISRQHHRSKIAGKMGKILVHSATADVVDDGWSVCEEKAVVDRLLDAMNDLIRTKSNKGVSLDEIPEIEDAIDDVLLRTENLKEKLGLHLAAITSSSCIELNGSSSELAVNQSMAPPPHSNNMTTKQDGLLCVNNQLVINNLLRKAGHIRCMIDALDGDGHIINDSGNVSADSSITNSAPCIKLPSTGMSCKFSHPQVSVSSRLNELNGEVGLFYGLNKLHAIAHNTVPSDCSSSDQSTTDLLPNISSKETRRAAQDQLGSFQTHSSPSSSNKRMNNVCSLTGSQPGLQSCPVDRSLTGSQPGLQCNQASSRLMKPSAEQCSQRCSDNDVIVLGRQLFKLKRWLDNIEEFTEADLEDLDLIVASVERHIRPDVDLNSASLRHCEILVIDSDTTLDDDDENFCSKEQNGILVDKHPPTSSSPSAARTVVSVPDCLLPLHSPPPHIVLSDTEIERRPARSLVVDQGPLTSLSKEQGRRSHGGLKVKVRMRKRLETTVNSSTDDIVDERLI